MVGRGWVRKTPASACGITRRTFTAAWPALWGNMPSWRTLGGGADALRVRRRPPDGRPPPPSLDVSPPWPAWRCDDGWRSGLNCTAPAGPRRVEAACGRPQRVSFRLVRGPVPYVAEGFVLQRQDDATTPRDGGELAADLWRSAAGGWGGGPALDAAVAASLASIREEAARRAATRRPSGPWPTGGVRCCSTPARRDPEH